MAEGNKALADVHARLGYKRLSRGLARLEIFFGLGAAGLGVFLGVWAASRPAVALDWAAAAWLLFVLGGYLALAGHRSHLYQSLNDQTAVLLDELRRSGNTNDRPQEMTATRTGITTDEHPR